LLLGAAFLGRVTAGRLAFRGGWRGGWVVVPRAVGA